MTDRRTFLSHFIICLALCAGLFFAMMRGIPQMIFANDASMATSAIGVFFVGSVAYLGWLSWRLQPSEFGWIAAEISVLIGLLGTTIGLSLQAKTLVTGTAGLMPLHTSLFSTMTGIFSAIVLIVLAFNHQAGIDRASR